LNLLSQVIEQKAKRNAKNCNLKKSQLKLLMTRILALIALVTIAYMPLYSQLRTNTALLQKAGKEAAVKEREDFQKLLVLAEQKKWPLTIKGKNNRIGRLVGVDPSGYPMYAATYNNLLAANTIRTNTLWQGGSTGLDLSGSSANMLNKLAVWDGGGVLQSHQELNGRITQKDNPPALEDHSTHVSGIMIGAGINPGAKGMAYGTQKLLAYDFNNHLSEMSLESPNILISNHSYGPIAGWFYNSGQSRWEFWGEATANEDYRFGYYSSETQVWDSIAYNAPFYLIVKAAGNNRDENGPEVGQPYFRYNAGGTMASAGNRPAGISSNDGYDIISGYGGSKNVLTVGAVTPIAGGYLQPADAILSSFSSWGPTDDGRIKPDVVADGVDLLSSVASATNAYAYFSGTSMSSPVAAGSLFLLQEYYSKLHSGTFMRSATLKGLVIHTADEAGTSNGPDYQFGWGLINMERAASVITSNNTDQLILENNLVNGANFTRAVIASGKGPLTVTISWTDPKGSVNNTLRLNNPEKKLINDLDIKITSGANTYLPWILDPNDRSAAATRGDNVLDNLEKITIPDAVPGQTYTITVTHKATLERGQQAYSLLVSGVGGAAYCASNATSSAGTRIDSVGVANIQNPNPAGCTTYKNFTNLTVQLQSNQSTPFGVKVGSCDASSADKVIKIFIDFNNNGGFEAGELVAQSNVISGNGTFIGNITVPAGIQVGNTTIMRVIAQETSNFADVNPCGTYARGETQDYRVEIVTPSNNTGVTELISPNVTSCALDSQMISVRIKNFGAAPQSNIPVTATIKNGATTIATFNAVYPLTIPAFGEDIFTFQAYFNAVAGTTYTITTKTSLANDQNTANDASTATVVISTGLAAPAGTAEKCTPTQAVLKVTNPVAGDAAYWYTMATGGTPIASGDNVTTSVIPANNTYYLGLNDVRTKVGPPNKMVYTSGGYNAFDGNFVRISTKVPLLIESARLYIGNPGKITFSLINIVSETATGYTYFPVASTTLNVFATTPTPQAGQIDVNNPLDTGAVFLLNLPIAEPGETYAIVVKCEDGATIFRNNNITTSPYPLSIPETISIIGNNVTAPTDFRTFYYFFYDMRILLADCPSPRVAVLATTVTAPVITLNGNVFTSNALTGNQWTRDGNPIAGANGQTHTATASGLYKSVVTTASGCNLNSNEINFVSTAVVDVNVNEISLTVSPNPNDGRFQLQFEMKKKDNLQISLINPIGQTAYAESASGFIGKYNKQLNIPRLSSGMYILKIQHGSKVYVKKVSVVR
jgi:hypothetical protein